MPNRCLPFGIRVALIVCVPRVFTIVIADRNPHVRGFLQREMSKDGYRIRLADSAQDLLQLAFNHEPIDLIILDPDLPDAVDANLLGALQSRTPPVPVIIHTHYTQSLPETEAQFIVVEKGGSSVEHLKQITESLLRQQPAASSLSQE
jgi:DNA-binding NtrC family response regulator